MIIWKEPATEAGQEYNQTYILEDVVRGWAMTTMIRLLAHDIEIAAQDEYTQIDQAIHSITYAYAYGGNEPFHELKRLVNAKPKGERRTSGARITSPRGQYRGKR